MDLPPSLRRRTVPQYHTATNVTPAAARQTSNQQMFRNMVRPEPAHREGSDLFCCRAPYKQIVNHK